MGMKSTGIHWVESIYQTFETVCGDVDSAMNQAPMKFVGNPVLTAGKGVQKFCSSMMQDLLPPVTSGNDDTCKPSTEESDYIEGFIESMNIEENEFYMICKQPVEVDNAAKRANQGTDNYVQDSSPVERQESNVKLIHAVCNDFDSGTQAVAIKPQDSLSQVNVSCRSAITEMASSLKVEKPHSDPYHEYEHIETPSDGLESLDKILSSDTLFQMKASCNSVTAELTSSQLIKKSHPNPNYEYKHIETPSDGSDGSSTFESAKGEVKLSNNISEDALPDSTKNPNMSDLDNPTNVIVSRTDCNSEKNDYFQQAYSSKLFAISSNSYDADLLRVGESENLSCSSGSIAEQGWGDSTLDSSMFSDICISDDLSDSEPLAESFSVDDIKLIQRDLYTNTHSHFASSRIRPSLKSYKKLLQDTLNSKRRLAKEYKHLGIWHGDIYEEHECTTSIKSSIQPTTTSTSTDIATLSQNLSEWELL